ncbi:MAG: hypothetical protein F2536_01890 [Actinobacteria bacterium]|nr:hypothetical protein [Actinomycetota bacterium]MTA89663.1 hypothetical protein [Actinomycetota bacterium]
MSKNMTRKGLAVGTTFALTLAGLVGVAAPAHATTGITVEPSAGTSYNMISGEQFNLRVFGQSNYAGTFSNLKWAVTNAGAATVTVKQPDGSPAASETPATNVADGSFSPAGSSSASSATSFVVTPANIGTAAGSNLLGVSVPAATAATIEVRAFIDLNGNGSFDSASDLSANVATVTFTKPADLTATTTITSPTEGDTSIVASVSFNNINNEQVPAANVGAFFTKGDGSTLYPTASVTATVLASNVATYTASNNFLAGQTVVVAGHSTATYNGTLTIASASATQFTVAITNANIAAASGLTGITATSAAANSVKSNSTWSATDKFKFTSSTVSALVKATGVKVQPLYKVSGSPASTDTVATAATAVVVARKAATIVGDVVANTTGRVTNAGTAGQTLLNSSFQAKVVVKDGATTPAGVGGAAVTATITSTGLQSTAPAKTLTVNGTTYSSSSALPGQGSVAKLALTTNASGEAVINFTSAGYSANDTITVVFYTENLTASTLTITQVAASYTATVRPSFFVTTDGTAVSVPVVVYDQFGGVPADKYDVRATFDANNNGYSAQATTAATSGSNAVTALVGGRGTLSITDNGTGLGVNSYDVTVQERLAGNNYGSTITTAVEVNVHIVAAATLVAATVTSNGTQDSTTKVYAIAGPVALSLVTPTAYDSVTVLGAAPTSFTGALTAQNITGTVSTVANATTAAVVVPGALVTVSSPGMLFQDGSTGRYTVGSITVSANTSGVYSVNVYSNKSGKQTFAISSGAASATTTVVFAAAAATTGTSLVIDAPDYVRPGSTLTIKGLLKDKYGNNIDTTAADRIKVSYTGPGLQVGSTPTAYTEGVAQLGYFLGSNDTGTISVTFSYNSDGTDDVFTSDTDLTVTKTITIGTAPAAAKVNVGSFNGKLVVYANGYNGKKISWKVGGKWGSAVAASDTARFARVTPRKGVTVSVQIYVDGVLTLTKSVVTK